MGKRPATAGSSASKSKKTAIPPTEPVITWINTDRGAGGGSGSGFGKHQADALKILAPTANPAHFLVNAPHWANVERAYARICDHDVFRGITTEMPLGLQESGITPFSIADYQLSIVNGGRQSYTCGANALWASPLYTTTPGVPINRQGARLLEPPLSTACCV